MANREVELSLSALQPIYASLLSGSAPERRLAAGAAALFTASLTAQPLLLAWPGGSRRPRSQRRVTDATTGGLLRQPGRAPPSPAEPRQSQLGSSDRRPVFESAVSYPSSDIRAIRAIRAGRLISEPSGVSAAAGPLRALPAAPRCLQVTAAPVKHGAVRRGTAPGTPTGHGH